jgi:hypothetical protein
VLPPVDVAGSLLLVWALTALVVALAVLFVVPSQYPKFPIDAYYYLEMARNVALGRGPVVRFEQGVPLKFFPGYPLALGVFSVAAPPHVAWYALHALLLVALFWLTAKACQCAGAGPSVAWTTVALVFAQPVFLKWATLPYAELLTLTLGMAVVVLVARALRRPTAGAFVLAGLCAGYAAVTRPTAAFYTVAAVCAIAALSPPDRRLRPLAWFVAAAALLPVVYLAIREVAGGHALPYWTEFLHRPPDDIPINRFIVGLVDFAAVRKVAAGSAYLELALTWALSLFLMALVVALRGYLGRLYQWATVVVVAFLAAHSQWGYTSERFILPVLPAAMLALARLLEWLTNRERGADAAPRRYRMVFSGLVGLWCLVWWLYMPAVIGNHISALHENTGRPHALAQIANADPSGTAWIEIGPEFAYFYEGQTYFDKDEPFFYMKAAEDEGRLFQRLRVRWIVTRDGPAQWLGRHPRIAALGVALVKEADDGMWTLYRVRSGAQRGTNTWPAAP